jgi:hypothetical protein
MKATKPKKLPTRSKMVTGYIIYASEIRKEIIKKHPQKDFGEISKIVGVEWKNLAQESKVNYEKRAQEQNSLSKIQFMASAAAAAAAVTTTTTTTTTTVNVVAAANGAHHSMGGPNGSLLGSEDSLEKAATDNSERQFRDQQQQQQQQQQHHNHHQQRQQHQQHQQQQQQHQQQQHHYSQQQAAYYSQLLDQATPILIRPTYQVAGPNGMPSVAAANDALLDQQSQSQHSQQSQSPAQSSPPQQQQQQQQQQPQQPAYQLFPTLANPQSQPMQPAGQQQTSPQMPPYQLFQYPQQPTMVQYCNDPACCASGRYQPYPYPFSPPAPATTPSNSQQQQQQQQLLQHQPNHLQSSPLNSPPPYEPFRRNNIIYRKPSLVRLRPKDVATQTDPIAWLETMDKMSPKKELRFSDKFIEHISSLGSSSPNKITDAAECH